MAAKPGSAPWRPISTTSRWRCRTWDGRIFIVGYSSGGYGALAAVRELHTNPRYQGIALTGAACMAGPFNFAETMRGLLAAEATYARPDIQVQLLQAYHDCYPEAGLFSPEQALHPRLLDPGPEGFDQGDIRQWLEQACPPDLLCRKIRFRLTGCQEGALSARSVLSPGWVETQLLSQAWPDTPVGRILKENDLVGGWHPKVPILLASSPTAECVPAGNTRALMEAWTRAGAEVPMEFYPLNLFGVGVDHMTGAPLALAKAFRWIGTLKGPTFPALRSHL